MSNKVTILGAGESGVGAALLAKSKGEEVFVSDSGSIAPKYKETLLNQFIHLEEGGHNEDYILNSDLVVKSPGIPEKAPLIQKLKAKNIPVISEIEYAAWCSRAKFIAITGSNGKTTTTLLTYHLLKSLGLNVGLAGNIGDSLAKQVIEDNYDYYVLELSSFQLDDMYKFRADVAVLLNITPDHLDRYEYNFQNYVDSKFRITQNQNSKNFFISFSDDEVINRELANKDLDSKQLSISLKNHAIQGAWWDGDKLNFQQEDQCFSIDPAKLPLKGKHNLINIMAAVSVAVALGLETSQIEDSLIRFQNAPHRLEVAGQVKGIEFVNDSKATNVDSVWYALDSFKKNIVWIAGGVDKGNDYKAIEGLVKEKVKALVCLGKDNSKLHKAFEGTVNQIQDTQSMVDAVSAAYRLASEGDVILLSPACASFDLFKNYEDRGAQFKKYVQELIEKEKNGSLV